MHQLLYDFLHFFAENYKSNLKNKDLYAIKKFYDLSHFEKLNDVFKKGFDKEDFKFTLNEVEKEYTFNNEVNYDLKSVSDYTKLSPVSPTDNAFESLKTIYYLYLSRIK